MRHEVPQFIDIEDKIFGPFTFFQGLYLVGGFFGGFSIYYFIGLIFPDTPFAIKAFFGLPILALGVSLAFVKVNRMSFIKYLEAWFYFLVSPKKYIWKKEDSNKKQKRQIKEVGDDFRLMGEQSGSQGSNYVIQNQDYKDIKNKRSKLKSLANSLDMEI